MEYYRVEMTPDPLLEPSDENQWRQSVVDIIQTLVLAAILFLGINAVSARIRIESGSMQETLHPGDFVFVNKLAYRFGALGRGDVVVFDPPFDSPEPYIKRMIGLPGDEIIIEDGKVYINGELLPEPYIREEFHSNGNWLVPQDSVFFMGDNRNNSSDSRSWGVTPLENVIGKAITVYWPPEQWGALAPSAVAAESP
ncbi:MAG: signal peptidase I [Chloroflexi bacterium]|nr:signal peptidase I [Chloroflexota bacterium]MBU1661997.1 signal peptidase I [Chloroflexota bacterium]